MCIRDRPQAVPPVCKVLDYGKYRFEQQKKEKEAKKLSLIHICFGWQYPAADLAAVPAKVSVTSIVHKQEQTTLERPAFLSKDGLTAARCV